MSKEPNLKRMSQEEIDEIKIEAYMSKEEKIKKILLESGFKDKDIMFGRVNLGTGRKYLRVGYWRPLSDELVEKLNLFEDRYYDEDCGYKYSYAY